MNGRQTAVSLGLFAALYAAALVLTAPALDSFAGELGADSWLMLPIGLLFASPPLLAIWTVHGEMRAPKRLLVTTWLFIGFFLAAAYGQVRNYGCGDLALMLMGAVGWVLPYMAIVATLSLLRLVRRWRLRACWRGEQATESVTPPLRAKERQFTIRTLLIWTTATALLCAGVRWLAPYGTLETEWLTDLDTLAGMLFQGAILGLLVTLAGLPVLGIAWIVLADGRRPIWRLALITMTVGGILGGCAWFGHWTGGNDIDLAATAAMIELGVVIAGLSAVCLMRLCGYRLVRPARPAAGTAGILALSQAHPRRRFGLALTAFAVVALLLAGYAPFRLETWRRADEAQRWLALGWNVGFDDDGRIVGLTRNPDQDLAGSEFDLIELTDLRSLDFSHSRLTDVQFLQYPIHCPALAQLESLDLTGTPIGDKALANIGRFAALKELCLCGTKITDSGISHLSVLHGLQRLDVSDTAVALKQPPALPMLEYLDLEGTEVRDAELVKLTNFPQLKTLLLVRTNVTDAGLSRLGPLKSLTSLDLSVTDVTDDAAASLAPLTQLRSLNLELTAVTEAGFVTLHKALPEADVAVGANDAILQRVAHKDTVVRFGRFGRGLTRTQRTLNRLHARGNYPTRERDGDVVMAGAKTGYCPSGTVPKTVTDAGLSALAGQTAMEELDLRESGVTDAGLPLLTTLTGLKRLDLRGTAVTANGRDALAKALPGCEVLR